MSKTKFVFIKPIWVQNPKCEFFRFYYISLEPSNLIPDNQNPPEEYDEMAEAYIKDLKKTLPCAAFLNGEYDVKNLYAGVPVVIGKKGVEKIVEVKLSSKEKEQFNLSIKSVQELYSLAKKIDPEL